MKKRNLIIISGVLIILGFFLLRKQSRLVLPGFLQNRPNENLPSIQAHVIDSTQSLPPRMDSQRVKEWAKHDISERQLELQNFLLPKEGGDSILNIELRILPACFPGDADAIGMDLKASPSFKLLGTLEGMSRGTISESWEVPKALLSSGSAKTRFKLRASKEPLQLGFYLCTSKSGSSCQGKKVRDINEIFTEHLTKKAKAGQEERAIYYQYFLLDESGLRAFQGAPRGKAHFDNLKKYAAERNFQGQNINEGIDQAKQAIEALNSLPVKYEKETLIVFLPKYDATECVNIQNNVKKVVPTKKPEQTE